jgi:cell division septum initiation protein DivIVA
MWVEADVTDGPDVPGEWDPSGQAEPPAALLRRAISHVEQLLQRLERPGAPVEASSEAPSVGRPSSDLGMGSTVEASPGDDSGAIEPVLNNPVRRISSAAQAEALRVSLNAHEKANRLLAEASAIRAQSASEGEQILVEARELADRMQSEATEEAGLYVNRAREDAESLVSQAAAEMQRVRDAALEESERVRGEAAAEAQRMIESAAAESERLRAEADAEARQLLESATEESERVRNEARAEAETLRSDARAEAESLRSEADAEAQRVTESARVEADALRSDAEQLRESVQQEADRLLTASSEEAQRLRDLAQQDADRIRSDAENQARTDREAADAAIREVLNEATTDADQIRAQARAEGQAEAERLVAARVEEAAAAAQIELDAEKVRVYELLGYANDSVAEVRGSMRELIEALGSSMGTINGATGSVDALMTRLRDAAHEHGVEVQGPPAAAGDAEQHRDEGPDDSLDHSRGGDDPAQREAVSVHDSIYSGSTHDRDEADDDAEAGEEGRRPLGLLFGASHKSRASKR